MDKYNTKNRICTANEIATRLLCIAAILLVVIINSKLLKIHLRTKCRASAYSRAPIRRHLRNLQHC